VKYGTYHKEKSRKWKNDPTRIQNWIYDSTTNSYICGGGRRLVHKYDGHRRSDNGYESTISVYECESCVGCSYKESCTKAKGNRVLSVNHRNNALRAQAREFLDSREGEALRKRRSIEPESVFGNLKANYGVTRFSLRKLDKVTLEWGLHSIAHNMRKMAKATVGG
jgi:hypothetical protein